MDNALPTPRGRDLRRTGVRSVNRPVAHGSQSGSPELDTDGLRPPKYLLLIREKQELNIHQEEREWTLGPVRAGAAVCPGITPRPTKYLAQSVI